MLRLYSCTVVCDYLFDTVKVLGLLQPYFWSSQLHACCVRDTLQTSRDTSNSNQSLSVVEKLLPFGSSCRKPSYLVTLLAFLP